MYIIKQNYYYYYNLINILILNCVENFSYLLSFIFIICILIMLGNKTIQHNIIYSIKLYILFKIEILALYKVIPAILEHKIQSQTV